MADDSLFFKRAVDLEILVYRFIMHARSLEEKIVVDWDRSHIRFTFTDY